MGTDRENVVPGNLIIIWKLNEAWPLKRTLTVTFWRLLKFLKLKENSTTALRLLKFLILKRTPLLSYNSYCYTITVLKFLIPKKDSITFLGLLKFLALTKGSITSLTLRGCNFEKWLCHILITPKVYQNSYFVECWRTAVYEGRLSYHIYD